MKTKKINPYPPKRCNCIGAYKGRPVHEMNCPAMGTFFYTEEIIDQFPGRWKRRENESVDECMDRILKDHWGIYYPWHDTEITGSD